MCLSTVYSSTDENQIIMEYVSRIDVDGENITFMDVMGTEKTVCGTLDMVDLTGAVVKVHLR